MESLRARILFPSLFLIIALGLFLGHNSKVSSTAVDSSENSQEVSTDDPGYPAWMDDFIDPPPGVSPTKVYTFECELLSRKPTTLTTTCADFGIAVQKIKWNKWSAEGAEGSGEYVVNDCSPDCASGNLWTTPVKVFLGDLTTDGKSYFLNTLTFVPLIELSSPGSYVAKHGLEFNGSAQINGKEVAANSWDLSSFYREVPEMRTELP